jgi:outer membrane protein OmpA-like peptidoglycan-associated protein
MLFAASACSQGPALRGKIKGLSTTVADAEKNGAMTCAPRELAIAKSQLEFAAIDLDQGEFSQAVAHVDRAEPNALAAFSMSPADRCTSREFIEVAAPPPVDKDTDSDGIVDSKDQCLLEPEDKDGYLDDDGCPDLDNDGDGIADALDHCPNEPETFNGIDDADGCPDSGIVSTGALVLPELSFEAGKSTLSAAATTTLNHAADRILAAPTRRIRIEGHADRHEAHGNAAVTLSEARALTVREYLIKRGVDPSKLQAVGYGASRPKAAGDTPQAHALNRRVEFIDVDQ